jgi:hypothetical protein
MSFIVLGLGADPRMFTGLSEGPGGTGLPVEEPILTYKPQSLDDVDPFGFLDFLDLLDFLLDFLSLFF